MTHLNKSYFHKHKLHPHHLYFMAKFGLRCERATAAYVNAWYPCVYISLPRQYQGFFFFWKSVSSTLTIAHFMNVIYSAFIFECAINIDISEMIRLRTGKMKAIAANSIWHIRRRLFFLLLYRSFENQSKVLSVTTIFHAMNDFKWNVCALCT